MMSIKIDIDIVFCRRADDVIINCGENVNLKIKINMLCCETFFAGINYVTKNVINIRLKKRS